MNIKKKIVDSTYQKASLKQILFNRLDKLTLGNNPASYTCIHIYTMYKLIDLKVAQL